jgi:cytochrome b subunit of formate dehydrogenase
MTEGLLRGARPGGVRRMARVGDSVLPSRVVRSSRVAILFLGILLLAAPAVRGAAAPSDDDCLMCHTGGNLPPLKRAGKTIPLDINPAVLKSSAHAGLHCVQCHVGFDPDETPHKKPMTPVDCASCHKDVGPSHGFHAPATMAGRRGSVGLSCTDCHGTHDVERIEAKGPKATRNVTAACARCHKTEVEEYLKSAHGQAAAQGVTGAPGCLTCHNQPITFARADGDTVAVKIRQEKLCLGCHLDDPRVRARMAPTAGFIAAYENSVHGKALQEGNGRAANCVDCHGSHVMAKGLVAGSKVNKEHIPDTCGKCHGGIERRYNSSVHAKALAEGATDAPVCTDCHGEHTIQKANAPNSRVAPANVSQEVCSPCHSSVRLASKYGIKSDRFKTFSDSFHGLAIRGGLVSAANCASCHGAHDILPSSDPRSSVYPGNLVKTCGKCHPGANAQFASGKVHVEMTEKAEPLLYWIALVYTILIVLTVGGMFVHNVFDLYRKARHRLLVRRGLAVGPAPVSHALYVRMTLSERLQHGALLVSFTLLVITGFMLQYPEAWWVEPIKRLGPIVFDLRSLIHRIMGVVLIAAGLWHVGYLTLTQRGREFFHDIMLRPDDLGDIVGAFKFYLGRQHERPKFGRFSYVEKSEYWALVWGTVVMGATGIILWAQDPFIALLSKLGWDAARTIHFYEAILATLAILVWHIYFVIFNPDVYPMNVAWLKGSLSEEEMEEEHPLELEAIRRKRREEEEARERASGGTARSGGTGRPKGTKGQGGST